MTKLPALGQSIKFHADIEIEDEEGYIFQIPAGTPVKVTEQDGDTFEKQYAESGTIAFGAEVGDVTKYNQFDKSGQSDQTVNGGLQWFDVDPEEFDVIED